MTAFASDESQLFQGFAQAYLDKNIADTSGEMLPLHPVINPVFPAIVGSTSLDLKAKPFVLFRYAPVFSLYTTFTVATKLGASSHSATRPLTAIGDWEETLPATIGCGDERQYVIAVTRIGML